MKTTIKKTDVIQRLNRIYITSMDNPKYPDDSTRKQYLRSAISDYMTEIRESLSQ